MTVILQEFDHSNVRTDLPNIKPGHIVKVYQKIVEKKGKDKKLEIKERIQIFEGLVIGRKGGTGINATITVRKISDGIGVERVFPLSAPTIEKIELIKIVKTRRAKLNYMRDRIGKATRPKGEIIKQEDDKQDKSDKKIDEKAAKEAAEEEKNEDKSKEVKKIETEKKEEVAENEKKNDEEIKEQETINKDEEKK